MLHSSRIKTVVIIDSNIVDAKENKELLPTDKSTFKNHHEEPVDKCNICQQCSLCDPSRPPAGYFIEFRIDRGSSADNRRRDQNNVRKR